MELFMPLLTVIAPRVLFLALFVIGIVMALNRQARHPAASRLAIIAFVLLIAAEVLTAASNTYVMSHRDGSSLTDLAQILAIINIANLLLHIVGMTLLVLAVFADRSTPAASAATPATTSASR
jgi:hypothetical protein